MTSPFLIAHQKKNAARKLHTAPRDVMVSEWRVKGALFIWSVGKKKKLATSSVSDVMFEMLIPKLTDGMWTKPYLRTMCEMLAKAAPTTGMR